MKRRLSGYLLLITLINVMTTVPAADMCPRPDSPETEAIEASAKYFSGIAGGKARLSGAVQIQQGDNRIRAERIDYDAKTRRLRASGDVRYTNCVSNDPFWFLATDQLSLSQRHGVGTIKNAWLVVNDTPLIYLPRYRLLSERQRQSGFLSPDISTSSNSGLEFGLPYYFNIAPNHDATIEPRILSRRGVQFASNYRYLYRFHEGTLKGNWLDDRDYKSSSRYSYSINHLSRVGERFRTQLRLQRVSDEDYIEDLGGAFNLSAENYISNRVLADYVWRGWHLNLMSQSLQAIDDNAGQENNLYEKKPAMTLAKSWHAPRLGLDLSLRNEWVKFNNKGTPANELFHPDGERFDSEITVRQSYRRPGFHFTPSVAMRHTDYKIDGGADKSRTLPWFSLHTGLTFERYTRQKKYRHTLEPQLFYLNVPHREQSGLPVFDTGISEFRFSQLFEANRYNSADRIGDADQLTVALIHRVIHSQSGQEAMRIGVGHTSYFKDRNVSLPDENTDTSRYDYSDLASEFSLNLDEKIKFTSALIWDTEAERPRRYSARLTLNAGDNKIINLSHRYRRKTEGFNQGEISFNMPIGTGWDWFGGWRYDLRAGKNIGVMAGFVYKSCCWSFGLAGERLLQSVDGEDLSIANGSLDYNTRFGIQFNLRGLGGLKTSDRGQLLENWIEGYYQ